ncbi:MAG: carboxypeptidase-like regulatory domain-containing protein, partial [Acidobacteriota bacterium]
MSAGIVRRAVLLTLVFSGLWLALSSPASAALATLTGKVTDLSGAGIFNVTINFVDACTGVTSPATGNVTSSTGDFRATVNAGVYDLEFSPPAGSLYHAWRIRNFDLTVSRTLAPVGLGFGVIVSGRVNDSAGAGIPNVFVRFFPPGSSDRTFAVRDR